MKVTDLPKHWESTREPVERSHDYNLRLPLEDAARIAALAELYPDRSEADILNDMIGAALDDLVRLSPLKDKLENRGKQDGE
jgi:predicted DNA-binding protein